MMDPLKPYQEEGTRFLVERQKAILADEPGLGKTRTALEAVKTLTLGSLGRDVLVVAPRMATGVWKREIQKWFGYDVIVYTGLTPPHKRKQLWAEFAERPSGLRPVLIINYNMVLEIAQRQTAWQAIICDEIHIGGLLNRKSKTYSNFRRLQSRFLFLLTGTPVRRDPSDLYAPLALLNPYQFNSYWTFVKHYCIVLDTHFGYEIAPRPKDVSAYKKMLDKYLIRHTKKQVLKELPPKTRTAVPLDMTKEQAKLYRRMAKELIMELESGEYVLAANTITKITRLRQLLVSPQLLGSKERGAALEALIELVIDEYYSERAVVVCTPYRNATTLIAEELTALGASVFVIHGKIEQAAADIAEQFQACQSKRKALVYTVKSGASFTAHAASTAFFVGYEWSAIDNLQAEDRIHRIGQTDPVNIYYFLHSGTIDEAIMERLDEKTMAKNWVLYPEEVVKCLKGL